MLQLCDMAIKERFVFDSLTGRYASCLLTLGFSALQLLAARLPALGQLLSETAGAVGCTDLQPGPGLLRELLLLCNWRTQGERKHYTHYKNHTPGFLWFSRGTLLG